MIERFLSLGGLYEGGKIKEEAGATKCTIWRPSAPYQVYIDHLFAEHKL